MKYRKTFIATEKGQIRTYEQIEDDFGTKLYILNGRKTTKEEGNRNFTDLVAECGKKNCRITRMERDMNNEELIRMLEERIIDTTMIDAINSYRSAEKNNETIRRIIDDFYIEERAMEEEKLRMGYYLAMADHEDHEVERLMALQNI